MSGILTEPHPCRHIVYPYTDEGKGVNAISLFASSGLSRGESVVLVMADFHHGPITARLAKRGFDLAALKATGQLNCIGAEGMLLELMCSGKVNDALFKDWTGREIARARASSPSGKVRVFGEMVSLLLARDEFTAAERLETLWNEAIEIHNVSLLCTYTLLKSGYRTLPDSLAKLHTHDLSAPAPVEQTVSAND